MSLHISILKDFYMMLRNYSVQGWRSLVKRGGLKIRWLRPAGVQLI